jgi:hypothetical protein
LKSDGQTLNFSTDTDVAPLLLSHKLYEIFKVYYENATANTEIFKLSLQ